MFTKVEAMKMLEAHNGEWFGIHRGRTDHVSSVTLGKFFGVPLGRTGEGGAPASGVRDGIRAERAFHINSYLWRLTLVTEPAQLTLAEPKLAAPAVKQSIGQALQAIVDEAVRVAVAAERARIIGLINN